LEARLRREAKARLRYRIRFSVSTFAATCHLAIYTFEDTAPWLTGL
jgi:hypothetical protein